LLASFVIGLDDWVCADVGPSVLVCANAPVAAKAEMAAAQLVIIRAFRMSFLRLKLFRRDINATHVRVVPES
jgi:hypothetical protein